MSTYSSANTLKAPLNSQTSYPQFKAEDNCFHSRWLYGNHTAHLITRVRNSNLAESAYSPNGEVQHQGYRVLYGITLTASTILGLVLDTIRNFLAIASIYFLGKRIWEYRNNEGPFASKVEMHASGIAQSITPEVQITVNASPKKETVMEKSRSSRPVQDGTPDIAPLDEAEFSAKLPEIVIPPRKPRKPTPQLTDRTLFLP